MISKNLSFNLMKEDLKRRLWAPALAFLIFFFSMPVSVALALSEGKQAKDWTYLQLVSHVNEVWSLNNNWILAIIVLLSLVLGINSFSWLHSRRKVDFYHCLPVRREKLFFVHFLNGILIFLFAYGLNLVFTLLIGAANGVAPKDAVPYALIAFGYAMVHFTLLYSVTVLSMMLTGNILVGILGSIVLNAYFPLLYFALNIYVSEFFHSIYNQGSRTFLPILRFLSDKCSAFSITIQNYSGGYDSAFGILYALAAAVVLIGISLLLYRKRGSEAAGKAMAFQISMPIIRIPIVILAGICGGLFFWVLHSSTGWAFFGILCGLLLFHCIMEIIYHFDFKKLFSHRASLAACAAIAVFIFCFFRYDLSGYDRYIPNPGELKSVSVSFPDMENWVSYRTLVLDQAGDYQWRGQTGQEYQLSHVQISNKDWVIALAKDGISQLEQEKAVRFDGAEEREYAVYRTDVSVRYTLNNGKKIYRTYTDGLGSDGYQLVKKIYDSRDYRMNAYPLMNQTAGETGKVRVTEGDKVWEVTRDSVGGDAAVNLLLKTYQEELAELSAKDLENESPAMVIQFLTLNEVNHEQKRITDRWQEDPRDSWVDDGKYPVYPSFTKTIALLGERGIDERDGIDKDKAVQVDIDLDDMIGAQEGKTNVPSQFTVTDQGQIRQLLSVATMDYYSDMNPFWDRGDRIGLKVTMMPSVGDRGYQYGIKREDAPPFLKEAAEEYLKKVQAALKHDAEQGA